MANLEELTHAQMIDPGLRSALDLKHQTKPVDVEPVKKNNIGRRLALLAVAGTFGVLGGVSSETADDSKEVYATGCNTKDINGFDVWMDPCPGVGANIDTRVPAGGTLRVNVPQAVGGKTVIGNLAATNQNGRPGYVTAYGCDEGIPRDSRGRVSKSDLNHDGKTTSNRLIVKADNDGDVCFNSLVAADLVVDINGVAPDASIQSFPNQRTDTRNSAEVNDNGMSLIKTYNNNYIKDSQIETRCVSRSFSPGFYDLQMIMTINGLGNNSTIGPGGRVVYDFISNPLLYGFGGWYFPDSIGKTEIEFIASGIRSNTPPNWRGTTTLSNYTRNNVGQPFQSVPTAVYDTNIPCPLTIAPY